MDLIIFLLFLLVCLVILRRPNKRYSHDLYGGNQQFLDVNGFPLSGGRVSFVGDDNKEISSLNIDEDGNLDDYSAYRNPTPEAKYCYIYDGADELLIKMYVKSFIQGAAYE